MDKFKDYYKILGVTPRASFESIRNAAERELGQNWNNAMGRLEIQEAYEILSDSEKRKEYDLEFSKRLSERERAIRNARTFEEYIAATSLHSELANVDVAPEVTVEQEVVQPEVKTEEVKEVQGTVVKPTEEKEETATTDLISTNNLGELTHEKATDISEVQQQEEQKEEEQKEEEQKEEEQKEEEQQEEQKEEEQKEEEQQEEQKVDADLENLSEEAPELTELSEEEKKAAEEKEKWDQEHLDRLGTKKFNRKQILKGTAVILGSTLFFGPIGTIVSSVIVKKSGKFALKKSSKTRIIKGVKTDETKIIDTYKSNLQKEIDKILSKPVKNDSDNYKLEIAIAKYKNSAALLEKRIEFRRNELDALGMKAHNRLHLLALKSSLNTSIKWLELRKKIADGKLKAFDNYSPAKNDKLTKLNKNIDGITEELSNPDIDSREKQSNTFKLTKLNVKKRELMKKMSLKKDRIARKQLFLATVNSITNRNNSTMTEEVVEEESVKSR